MKSVSSSTMIVKFCVVLLLVCCVISLIKGQSEDELTVKWGVADSTATVGKMFRLHIPSDAFTGKILSYTVQRSDGSPLPRWLHFDAKDTVLQGIPTPADAGQLYMDITAHGVKSQASVSSTILVRDISYHSAGAPLRFKSSKPEYVSCRQAEPETAATIIIDADLESLSALERLTLFTTFLSHMDLHEGMVKMLPVGDSPLHDSSALVSGSGDAVSPKTSGLFISWPVGCGQVKEGHFPVLQKLDDDSSSGKMAKVLGHSVIGWQVTNSRFQAPSRRRRQVQVTPTPAATPIMPTKTDKVDMTDDKMTHKLTDIQSPTFVQPTSVQPPIMKTDEHVVIPPVKEEDKSVMVMPTETTPVVAPVSRTTEMPPIMPTKTHEVWKPTDAHTGGGGGTDCMPGQKPEVKSHIPRLNYHVGDVIDYVIPENTFEDCEVGGTRGLELTLYNDSLSHIPSDYFLQFDSEKQKIVGLPMKEDVGRHRFILNAKRKSSTLLAHTKVTIHIKDAKDQEKINHELTVTIDYDYAKAKSNVMEKVGLANRIASIFGDPDTSNLIITKFQPGSVIMGWANSSLVSSDCPVDDINNLVGKLVNEDGSLSNSAIEKLKPFKLVNAQAHPAGACEGNPNFPVIVSKPRDSTTPIVDKQEEPKPTDVTTSEDVAKGSKGGEDEDDIWITTVVPAVVIVVILLIALLIACILYRRKRKGKMNVEEQNTFINKGAPVIFPDELEDRPSDINRPLLVEGGPAPPPEYNRGTSESPERQDTGTYRNISASTPADDGITEMPEKPYEPPPPVTASSNGKQPRPAHQPFTQAPEILP